MTDIPRLSTTFLKSDTAKTPKQREKEARKQTNKAKGITGEEKAIDGLCQQLGRPRTKSDRRNHQGRIGGGLGTPDIRLKGLEGWFIECKAEKNCRFQAYWDQLDEDCPPDMKKMFIYTNPNGRSFICYELINLASAAQDVVEASGYTIS